MAGSAMTELIDDIERPGEGDGRSRRKTTGQPPKQHNRRPRHIVKPVEQPRCKYRSRTALKTIAELEHTALSYPRS